MSHNDVERLRHEQRERGLRDWATSMTVSREEALQQGFEMGRREVLVPMIQFFEEILRQAQTPQHELESYEMLKLEQHLATLQTELQNPGS